MTSCPEGYFVTWIPSNKTKGSTNNLFNADSLSMIRFKPWTNPLSKPSADEIKEKSSGLSCSKCHYSCRTCVGPTNCTLCYSDSTLHKSSGRCYPTELVTEVVELERWYSAISVTFLCLCLVILFLVIYIVTDKNPGIILNCCPGSTSSHDQRSRRGGGSISLSIKRDKSLHGGGISGGGGGYGGTSGNISHGRVNPLASSSSMSPLNSHHNLSSSHDQGLTTKVFCDSEDDL